MRLIFLSSGWAAIVIVVWTISRRWHLMSERERTVWKCAFLIFILMLIAWWGSGLSAVG